MGILDDLGKTVNQELDRAKSKLERFQRLSRLQGELNDLKKSIEQRRLEFADRAIELYKAGQITSATLGEILKGIESLQVQLTLKEEEYRTAQNDPAAAVPPTPAGSQSVPVSVEQPPTVAPPPVASTTPGKSCPNCGFIMPATSLFCPSCGNRVGV